MLKNYLDEVWVQDVVFQTVVSWRLEGKHWFMTPKLVKSWFGKSNQWIFPKSNQWIFPNYIFFFFGVKKELAKLHFLKMGFARM